MITMFIGTRPELIKLRPVFVRCKAKGLPIRITYVRQHAAIADEIRELDPTYMMVNHEVMSEASPSKGWGLGYLRESHGVKLGIVQGDTSTAVGAAIAMGYQQIPVVHVEAGLRTFGRGGPIPTRNPFPEELNRQIIGRIASLHLCPTYGNEQNLIGEHIGGQIEITGNPGITALAELIAGQPEPEPQDQILVTCHRRENWLDIARLVRGLELVANQTKTWTVFVKHPNTRLYEGLSFGPGITISDPLPHDALIRELRRCKLVVTDSGGLLEEATWLGKRRLVLRAETERPEACAPLVMSIGDCHKDILAALDQPEPSDGSRFAFGDPSSADRCAKAIAAFYASL